MTLTPSQRRAVVLAIIARREEMGEARFGMREGRVVPRENRPRRQVDK